MFYCKIKVGLWDLQIIGFCFYWHFTQRTNFFGTVRIKLHTQTKCNKNISGPKTALSILSQSQNLLSAFNDVFRSFMGHIWHCMHAFSSLYGASLSMGGVPLICGSPNLTTVSVRSSFSHGLCCKLKVGLCQRHNTLLRVRAWAHCWQGLDSGHFKPASKSGWAAGGNPSSTESSPSSNSVLSPEALFLTLQPGARLYHTVYTVT